MAYEFTPEQLERILEKVRRDRAAQGLPPTVEDPEVLERLGRLIFSAKGAA